MGLDRATLSSTQISNNSIEQPLAIDHPMIQKMEETQVRINPYLPNEPLVDENRIRFSKNDKQKEILEILDQISQEVHQKPIVEISPAYKSLTRRISELNHKISIVAERYIASQKGRQNKKKANVEDNVEKQKSLKGWQATNYGVFGFLGAALSIGGRAIGGPAGALVEQCSQLCTPATHMFNSTLDGKLVDPNFQQQLYLSTIQSENQMSESVKNLLEKLMQLVLEQMRNEERLIQSMSQR